MFASRAVARIGAKPLLVIGMVAVAIGLVSLSGGRTRINPRLIALALASGLMFGVFFTLLGRAGGAWKPGRHIVYRKSTPMANLFLAMLDRMDVKVDNLGDSNGVLKGLSELA